MIIFLIILAIIINTALGIFILPMIDNEKQTLGKAFDRIPEWIGVFFFSVLMIIVLNLWFIAVYYALSKGDSWDEE